MPFSELPATLGYVMSKPCDAIHDVNYYVRPANYGRERHSHEMYQYLIVTDGAVTIECSGGTQTLTCGQVSLIPPHVMHVIYTEQGYTQIGFNFHPDREFMGIFPLVAANVKQPVVVKDTRFLEREEELQQLLMTYSTIAQKKVCLLIGEALLHVVEDVVYGNDAHFDTRLSLYLERHMDGNLTTARIAAHFHMSVPQLERLSQRYFQCGVMALYKQKRLSHARVLLTSTAKSISEIAQETGFYDAAHFSSFFRRQVGQSPSQWRKSDAWKGREFE